MGKVGSHAQQQRLAYSPTQQATDEQDRDHFTQSGLQGQGDFDRRSGGNLFQGGYDNGAAGASQSRSQKHAVAPLEMQQRPAHQGNQSQAQAIAEDHQQQGSGSVAGGLSQPEFGSACKKNEDQGQRSENIRGALEGGGPDPVPNGTKGHANQQQYNQVRHTGQTRQPVGNVCQHQQSGQHTEYAGQFHNADFASPANRNLWQSQN